MATINDVNLNSPVVIIAHRFESGHSRPIDDTKRYVMQPIEARAFVSELYAQGLMSVIEDTLQELSQRVDGTLLKTAFPSITVINHVLYKLKNISNELRELVAQWKIIGANEIIFEFEAAVLGSNEGKQSDN